MIHNTTIDTQMNHRSIRAFKDQSLTTEQLATLYDVARCTSSSRFLQQFSILHLTDAKKRAAVRTIAGQPYVGANGDLLIFIADLYRNQQLRHDMGQMMDPCTALMSICRRLKIQCWQCRIR